MGKANEFTSKELLALIDNGKLSLSATSFRFRYKEIWHQANLVQEDEEEGGEAKRSGSVQVKDLESGRLFVSVREWYRYASTKTWGETGNKGPFHGAVAIEKVHVYRGETDVGKLRTLTTVLAQLETEEEEVTAEEEESEVEIVEEEEQESEVEPQRTQTYQKQKKEKDRVSRKLVRKKASKAVHKSEEEPEREEEEDGEQEEKQPAEETEEPKEAADEIESYYHSTNKVFLAEDEAGDFRMLNEYLGDTNKWQQCSNASESTGDASSLSRGRDSESEDVEGVENKICSPRSGNRVIRAGTAVWDKIIPSDVLVFDKPFLGTGSFSVVKRGRWFDMPVAVKCIDKRKKHYCILDIHHEIDIWWESRHPNIVEVFGAIEDVDTMCIIMERMHGSLQQALEQWGVGNIYNHIRSWSMQIASAMSFLHRSNVLFRDLKDGNLLLSSDASIIKLTDFGLASPCDTAERYIMGTPEFMAPEFYKDHLAGFGDDVKRHVHSKKLDVWSFGILLWKMFHPRTYPYPKLNPVHYGRGKRHRDVLLKAVSNGRRPIISRNVPCEWADLLEQCWHADPLERPTFEEILLSLRSFHDPPPPSKPL
ncbi:copper transport protein ctr1 [Balamuthia mandrillaris]